MNISMFLSRKIVLLSTLFLACGFSQAKAEDLINENFDKYEVGQSMEQSMPACPVGKVWGWTGKERNEFGTISVLGTNAPNNKVLYITNNPHKEGQSPSVEFDWHDAKVTTAEDLVVEYKFMTPVEGPFTSCHFFGDGWEKAAAIFCVGDGQFVLEYGSPIARMDIGEYKANTWYTIRVELHQKNKTCDVSVDGAKKANNVPWRAKAGNTVNHVALVGDTRPNQQTEKPEYFLDDVLVQSVPAK